MYISKEFKLNVVEYFIPIESIKNDAGCYTKYIYGYSNEDCAIRIETSEFLIEYFYKYVSNCRVLYNINIFDIEQNILKSFKEKKILECKNIYVKKAVEIKNLFDLYLKENGYFEFPNNNYIISAEPHKYYNGIDELLDVAKTYYLQDNNIIVKNIFSGNDSKIKNRLITTKKITGTFYGKKNKSKPDYRKSYDKWKPIYFEFNIPILKI